MKCTRNSPPGGHLTTLWLWEPFVEETTTTPERPSYLSEDLASISILYLRHCVSENMQRANHLQGLWI